MPVKLLITLISIQVLLLALYFIDFNEKATYTMTTPMGKMIESDVLSSRNVTAFCQDKNHVMWIGTSDGLNLYNGNQMIQLFTDENDSTSLPDNNIQGIMRDSKDQMWVATPNGVARYLGGYRFKRFAIPYSLQGAHQMADWGRNGIVVSNGIKAYRIYNDTVSEFFSFSLKLGQLNYLYPDHHDGYWVIDLLHCVHYNKSGQPDITHTIPHSNLAYCQQVGDTLWVGQGRFVSGFNLNTNKRFFYNKEELPIIATLFFSDGDYLFLNSGYHGLYRIKLSTGGLQKISNEEMHLRHKDVTISALYKQDSDNVWIGYQNGGFQVSSQNYLGFDKNNNNQLNHQYQGKSINTIGATSNNIIGSSEDNIFCYDLTTRQVHTYLHSDIFSDSPFYRQTLEDVVPFEGSKVWLVSNVRICSCNITNNNINILSQCYSNIHIGPILGSSLRVGNDLLTVSNSAYLIRTTFGDTHIDSIPVWNDQFSTAARLADLHNGKVLIVMKGMRLALYDTHNNQVEKLEVKGNEAFHNDDPQVTFVDSHHRVWIGTMRRGLLRFFPESGKLTRVKVVPQLPIKSIDEDEKGVLWLSSNDQIISFNPNKEAIFFCAIPVTEKSLIRNACKIPGTDVIAYGTNSSVDFISVGKIKGESNFDLKITGIRLLDEDNNYKYVSDDFKDGNKYTFANDDNDIVVEFSSAQFGRWQNVMYQCMLEGFDKDWRQPTLTPNIQFHNLPAGSYTFRVRMISSPDHPALAEHYLKFRIKPSFLASPAAVYFYFLLVFFIIYYINSLYLRGHKNRLKVAQLEQERERNQRTNEMNMSFFTNISHEFRNPLTMIAGPLLMLRRDDSLPGSVRYTLNMVCKSVNLMLKLIDQMLDFNQLETDVLRLKVSEYDVVSELSTLISAFEEGAKLRNITIEREGIRGNLYVWMDKDKFEKIMSNLLTNALKHTPDNGLIRIVFHELDREQASILKYPVSGSLGKFFSVKVYNNGESISPERINDVFKRYYQIKKGNEKYQYGWGSGLGLYYVKQLVRLHHGIIWVQNESKGGVTFQFILPTEEYAYQEDEHVIEEDTVLQIAVDEEVHEVDRLIERNQEEVNTIAKKPVILIVDDDMAVAQYIRSLFITDYLVFNKYSAESTLEDIDNIKPDIILSDIVMGDMDGYHFCSAIRQNSKYSHVPIILITAKSNVSEQVMGLENGANAYVTKPFDPSYLKALVDSQLKNFNLLKEKMEATEQQFCEELSDQDRKFMSALYALMEKHLPEQNLNITTICNELLISHSKFNYKLKELTGETPGSFFRKFKLNKAAKLLREGKYNVSEISVMTGFGTVSYFSVAFKKQFGISPSEYK